MDEDKIEEILKYDSYIRCMKIIYNINPKSFKEDELPKKVQEHLKKLRSNGIDINNPIQIRKKKTLTNK